MKEYFTPREALQFFPWLKPGSGESTIRLWIKQGKLKAYFSKGVRGNPRTRRYSIPLAAIQEYLRNNEP